MWQSSNHKQYRHQNQSKRTALTGTAEGGIVHIVKIHQIGGGGGKKLCI